MTAYARPPVSQTVLDNIAKLRAELPESVAEIERAAVESRRALPDLDVDLLAKAFDLNGVNWPKGWGDNDFAWLARQVAAEYRRLAAKQDPRIIPTSYGWDET